MNDNYLILIKNTLYKYALFTKFNQEVYIYAIIMLLTYNDE